VLRHECRKRKTMSTVRSAPSTIVSFTPFSAFSMKSTSA
jgi:hypothetical protein